MKQSQRLRLGTRVSFVSIIVNLLLTFAKALAGAAAGSQALIADAVHSAGDVISTLAVMAGIRLADAPPDESHHYGHGRLESVTAKLVALLIIGTGVGIALSNFNAVRAIIAADGVSSGDFAPPTTVAMLVAVASIAVKEALYRYTAHAGRKLRSRALMADALHHRSDAVSSIAALAGLVGARAGWAFLDPLAGVVVGLLILHMGIMLYWQSVAELVDTAPPKDVVDNLRRVGGAGPGVINVNELRARLHGADIFMDLEICVDPDSSLRAAHHIAHETSDRIEAEFPNVREVHVHVNPCRSPDNTAASCRACAAARND